MAERKGGRIGKGLVWIVLILLIVGLAGFGATSFGGSVRSVGTVGDTPISLDRYARALQQQLRSFEQQTGQRITLAQAQSAGLDRAVLQQVVAATAIEDEAKALGISVGDEEVRKEVLQVPGFQGLDGQFDRETYEFALRQAGQKISEFEDSIRIETARTLLQGAVVGGVVTPEILTDTLFNFARETRDFSWVALGPEDLEDPLSEPSQEDLQAYYDENPAPFTEPEKRRITYVWLTPDMIVDDVEVDDETLMQLYEDRSAQYNQPERRLVERLVFATDEDAEAAAAGIADGTTDFDALLAERGLTLDDVDLGEVTREDLGADAAEPVFALTEPGIAGPVKTGLGPALFRVNGILNARETPFDEVKDELRAEYAQGAARRELRDEVEPIEDLLAGGATLEELAKETRLQTGEITWYEGLSSFGGRSIDGYEEFRTAAQAAAIGDFPEVLELSDGGIFAIRLDEIIEPALRPFDEVSDAVTEGWQAQETRKRLIAKAEAAVEEQKAGTPLTEQGFTLESREGQLRDAFIEDTPLDLVTTAFAMEPGETRVISTATGAVIVRLDAITPAEQSSDEAVSVRSSFAQQTSQSYAQDMMEAFTRALETSKGISLDQSAINAVHAQFN